MTGVFRRALIPAESDRVSSSMNEALRVSGARHEWAGGPVRLVGPLVDFDSADDTVVAVKGRVDDRNRLLAALGVAEAESALPDEKLIALAYRKWGRECTELLVGPFALAAWHGESQTLICIRDHLGIQPFYYHCGEESFAFADRIEDVLLHPDTPWDLDETAIGDFLALRENPERTFYQGVRRLPAGHILEVRPDAVRLERYWFPERIHELRLDVEERYAQGLRDRITAAVNAQADGSRISVSLSGGLDSSTIAVLAARTAPAKAGTVTAISAALPQGLRGREQDERGWIEHVLEQEGMEASFVSVPEATPFDGLEEKFGELGQPFRDVFYYLSDALSVRSRELGARVMLHGFGGDMVASFNGHGYLLHLLSRGRLFELSALVQRRARNEGTTTTAIIKSEILAPLLPTVARDVLHLLRGRTPTGRYAASAMSKRFRSKYLRMSHDDDQEVILRRSRNIVHRQLLSNVLHLSGTLEQAAMAANHRGVNLRFPLLDRRVIEYCLAMPPEQFFQGGRRRGLFRRAMKGVLPEAIRLRTDKGAFSPDFLHRVRAGVAEQKKFLTDLPLEHAVWEYVDRSKLLGEVERLTRTDDPREDMLPPARIIVHGAMLARFLVWHDERSQKAGRG